MNILVIAMFVVLLVINVATIIRSIKWFLKGERGIGAFLFAIFAVAWLIAVITIPIQNRKAAALQEMKIISNQIEEGEAE